ncbi:TonB-dependent receptor plug domain-containing protein, partial [Phenylobacterium sp.]|uniref:TonB-dependent receptor plug domain-containing protein n=1 Tax=Phenylobacterium sp. TaxID=1871053 RepID=UPI0035B460C5
MKSIESHLRSSASIAAISIAAALAAGPVLAAESAAYQVEEVVITANKRGAESVQDVGTSIGVLSGEALAQRDIKEFIDITRNVAGLNVVDQGPGQKTFMIRGLIGAGESTVGLYYDNLPTNGVRRQKFWDSGALDLAEDWARLGLISRRRFCGAASADVRGSVA